MPAGLQELNVQARVVELDAQLAAEVARRGWALERCSVVDELWVKTGSLGDRILPAVQAAYIGQGLVQK